MSVFTRPAPRWALRAFWIFVYSVVLIGLIAVGDSVAIALWVALPVLWLLVGTARIRRTALVVARVLGLAFRSALTAAIMVGVPLAILYFLVRFVKWAWTD
jgi:hypothetical protein